MCHLIFICWEYTKKLNFKAGIHIKKAKHNCHALFKMLFVDGIMGLVHRRLLDEVTKDRPSLWNEQLWSYSISLLLIHPCVIGPPTMRRSILGLGKIQKKVQTQLKIQGTIHIRKDSRMVYKYMLSCMMKTECAIACLGRLIGSIGWESFIEEA